MSLDPRSAAADDLLQALTVGDVDDDDPAVAARLADDPPLRERWLAVAATLADLRTLRADLVDPGPGTAQLDAHARIREFWRRAARRRWIAAGIAAAALLALAVSLWLLRPANGLTHDPNLGTGTSKVLTPDGEWRIGAPFEWPPISGAAGYRVEVQPPEGPSRMFPDDGELFRATAWLPTPQQRGGLPDRFQWRVLALDASQQELNTSGWATVSRR